MSTARYEEGEPEDPRERIGQVVGERYRLSELLGSGRAANVYAAEHTELDRKVAVKLLRSKMADDEETRERFEREARALATLSHPHVVNLIDHGVHDGCPYLVMELLEGRSLADMLAAQPMAPLQAIKITRQVLSAFIYAHDHGLLHRDLKPADVFVQYLPGTGDHVKVLDFGLAKFVKGDEDGGPPLTLMGMIRTGEPAYQAPEQLAGQSVDARADVYTAATMLFEMLAGRPPFTGDPDDVMHTKVVEDPPTLGSVRDDLEVDPGLEALLAKGLAKDPYERFASAQKMLSALDGLSQPVVTRRQQPPQPVRPAAAPPKERPKWLVLAIIAPVAVALLVVCAGLGLYWLVGDGDGATAEGELELEDTPNPWDEGVPPELAEVHEQLESERPVKEGALESVRAYAWANQGDPRPYLLEGHVLVSQGRELMAVPRYVRAHEIDPGARGDPRMLGNLIELAADPQANAPASDALRDIYGEEAVPAIERVLESPGALPSGGKARLERLRDQLEG